MFKTATKTESKLRLALVGPAGSGKTYTALKLAGSLGSKIAVIDTERGSASKYVGEPGLPAFHVAELTSHHPQHYIDAIKFAGSHGYDVLIIDSLSHAWSGNDGALELVDKAAKKSQSQNTYTAWRDVTPLHNQLVDAILQANCHVIATMRAKTEYVLETNQKGKQVPRKVGLAPIQRDGVEYEFDVTADLTLEHDMIIGKTRCPAVDGQVYHKPGKAVAEVLLRWVSAGEAAEPAPIMIDTSEPEDNTIDYLATIHHMFTQLNVPEKYLDTYLKKRFNGGKALAPGFQMSDSQFERACKDTEKVAAQIQPKRDAGEEVTDELLQGVFKAICAD